MPYKCELDRGGFVYAPVDDDTCVRAPREHIIRKKPGVSKELMRKIFGPDLGSCSDCNVEIGPMAVYEQLNGRSAFMGIVRYSSLDIMPDETSVAGRGATSAGGSKFTLVKLDDPQGPLDGPGHVMDDNEFLTEVSLYRARVRGTCPMPASMSMPRTSCPMPHVPYPVARTPCPMPHGPCRDVPNTAAAVD